MVVKWVQWPCHVQGRKRLHTSTLTVIDLIQQQMPAVQQTQNGSKDAKTRPRTDRDPKLQERLAQSGGARGSTFLPGSEHQPDAFPCICMLLCVETFIENPRSAPRNRFRRSAEAHPPCSEFHLSFLVRSCWSALSSSPRACPEARSSGRSSTRDEHLA